jgi:hypothetical protein
MSVSRSGPRAFWYKGIKCSFTRDLEAHLQTMTKQMLASIAIGVGAWLAWYPVIAARGLVLVGALAFNCSSGTHIPDEKIRRHAFVRLPARDVQIEIPLVHRACL